MVVLTGFFFPKYFFFSLFKIIGVSNVSFHANVLKELFEGMLLYVGKQTGWSCVHLEELRGVGLVTVAAVTWQIKHSEGGTVGGAEAFGDLYVELYLFEARLDYK